MGMLLLGQFRHPDGARELVEGDDQLAGYDAETDLGRVGDVAERSAGQMGMIHREGAALDLLGLGIEALGPHAGS